MAYTFSRVVGPVALGTSPATIFTASTQVQLRDVCVCNELASGAMARVFLSIGTDGAGKRLLYNAPVPGNAWPAQMTLGQTLEPGDVLQAHADTASALTITISGVLVT